MRSEEGLGVKPAGDLKHELRLLRRVRVDRHVPDENRKPEHQVGGEEAVRINGKLKKSSFLKLIINLSKRHLIFFTSV